MWLWLGILLALAGVVQLVVKAMDPQDEDRVIARELKEMKRSRRRGGRAR